VVQYLVFCLVQYPDNKRTSHSDAYLLYHSFKFVISVLKIDWEFEVHCFQWLQTLEHENTSHVHIQNVHALIHFNLYWYVSDARSNMQTCEHLPQNQNYRYICVYTRTRTHTHAHTTQLQIYMRLHTHTHAHTRAHMTCVY